MKMDTRLKHKAKLNIQYTYVNLSVNSVHLCKFFSEFNKHYCSDFYRTNNNVGVIYYYVNCKCPFSNSKVVVLMYIVYNPSYDCGKITRERLFCNFDFFSIISLQTNIDAFINF